MNKTLKITLTAFLITAGVIKGAPALAQPAAAQNVTIVHTTDLDLSSQAGRSALDHRLVVAAFEVCGTASDADLTGKNKVRACRSDVLAKARAQTDQIASRGGSILIAAAR
ncbi:MAG TPA: UrcA family protein [Sphingomicrobium sp.]|nr:UrcA family protein [Sphingomicrobium sp.]